jgi:L-asparaginase II
MANPVLVEVTRGGVVESVHAGAAILVDADLEVVAQWGDVDRPVFPRSALKPLQALAFVESGAADGAGLDDRHLALACASHNGEVRHTVTVARWLADMGLDDDALACGPQVPGWAPSAQALAQAGLKPCRVHNNCSGKHAGFLAAALAMGAPVAGYIGLDHPVQRHVFAALADLGGLGAAPPVGIDGCAAPNPAIPLSALARIMARFAVPDGLPPARASACRRIAAAMSAHPDLVAGHGRACTALMRDCEAGTVVKTGAEGVFVGILPSRGLGIALKIDDGATRASEAAITHLLVRLGALAEDAPAAARFGRPEIRNTNGDAVGGIRPAASFVL